MKIILNSLYTTIVLLSCSISVSTPAAKLEAVSDTSQYAPLVVEKVSGSGTSTSTSASEVISNLPSATLTQEIHSSFSEESVIKSDSLNLLETSGKNDPSSFILSNIDVSSQLSESVEAVVFTLVDSATELKNRVTSQPQDAGPQENTTAAGGQGGQQPPQEHYVVRAEPKPQDTQGGDRPQPADPVEPALKPPVNQSETKSSQEETSKTVEGGQEAPQQPEDILSFREWSQKQLAEAERKKGDQNTTDRFSKPSGKIRNKNYASPDCGAKIAATNPESVSPSSVLSSSKDEYMLNYCTSRIWFVLELCEAIQAKQLDLANFELFSSSPKHFSVSISSRFPTRDWNTVGKFTAVDSRDIQTFDLNPQLFGKFVKIELHSHYGKEHFCPISWVRVYGTSEYEVLAKEDERHAQPEDDDDDDDDEELVAGGARRDAPKNLFSSATDAVLSIVKKATAPFIRSHDNETAPGAATGLQLSHPEPCWTPRHIAVCDNCSQHLYDTVFYLLSCRQHSLTKLIASPFISKSLIETDVCGKFGFDFNSLRSGAPFPAGRKVLSDKEQYLSAMLKECYVAALCNSLAAIRNKVVVNSSMDSSMALKNLTVKEPCETEQLAPSTCTTDCSKASSRHTTPSVDYSTTSHLKEIFKPSQRFSEKIKPTKTLKTDQLRDFSSSIISQVEENTKTTPDVHPTTVPSGGGKVMPTATVTEATEEQRQTDTATRKDEAESKVTFVEKKVAEEAPEAESGDEGTLFVPQDTTLDSILHDLSELEIAVNSDQASSSSTVPPSTNLPKESIFLRLANRIKNLELNMSLSSSYLEEMSRRYRQQLEALAKTVNATAQRVDERLRVEEERERRREEEMAQIRSQLANLTRDVAALLRDKSSWRPGLSVIGQHVLLVTIELCIVWFVFSLRRRDAKPPDKPTIETSRKASKRSRRRNSVEGVTGHASPQKKMTRRPSDEALEIALAGSYCENRLKIKKKRKKKESVHKASMSSAKRKKSEASNDSEEREEASEKVPKGTNYPVRLEVLLGPAEGEVETTNRFAPFASPGAAPPAANNGAPGEAVRRFSSPVFMKTALSARTARLPPAEHPSDRESSQESSVSTMSAPAASLRAQPDTSRPQPPPKDTKRSSGGLKKYMKKFF